MEMVFEVRNQMVTNMVVNGKTTIYRSLLFILIKTIRNTTANGKAVISTDTHLYLCYWFIERGEFKDVEDAIEEDRCSRISRTRWNFYGVTNSYGDKYGGEWKDFREHGHGVYTKADGMNTILIKDVESNTDDGVLTYKNGWNNR